MTILRLFPAAATHRGMRRKQNEDAIGYEYPEQAATLQAHGALFVVADGVGGLDAGDQASRQAVDELINQYYSQDVEAPIENRLRDAIEAVNQSIYRTFQRQGATTLVAVVLFEDQLIFASVGDSQIFHLSGQVINQLNELDIITEAGEDQGALTKAIGYRETLEVEPQRLTVDVGDKVLLCSDGLTRYLDEAAIVRFAESHDPRDSVRRMINQANTQGGADNISALLITLGEPIDIADINKHIDRISVRVAVDTDPLMMQDVPSKPTTQIPTARPVPAIDESLLDESIPAPSQSAPSPTPSAPQAPVEKAPEQENSMLIFIVIGVVILVAGIAILGIAFTSLREDNTASDRVTETPPITTTTSDASPTQVNDGAEIAEGTIIVLGQSISLKSDVGSTVESFLASPDTRYIVDAIAQDTEGNSWYRLLEEETGQVGWSIESALPDYEAQEE